MRHRLGQGRVTAAHLVGRDHLALRKHGADLRVEGVQHLWREALVVRHPGHRLDRLLGLGLHQDEDRHVVRVRLRPGPDLLQAAHEGLAVGDVVDVLDVHHLEAGLGEHALLVESRGAPLVQGRPERVGEAAALGVGVDVELHLADAMVELHGQRRVAVVQPVERLGVGRLQELGHAWRQAGVIAVVAADHLDLVDADVVVGAGGEAVGRGSQGDHGGDGAGEGAKGPGHLISPNDGGGLSSARVRAQM